MSRLLVFTVIASLGSGSAAFAGESLLQSASRIVQETTRAQTATRVNRIGAGSPEVLLGQDQAALSKSGLKKRTKVMIYLAAGVGFAATAYTIDHKVLNVTPSSLGTRKD